MVYIVVHVFKTFIFFMYKSEFEFVHVFFEKLFFHVQACTCFEFYIFFHVQKYQNYPLAGASLQLVPHK